MYSVNNFMEDEDEPISKERKVSIYELFAFATFGDKLLIIIGSIFAVIEGAGAPAMALVFGGMTNTLVETVKFGFAGVNDTASQDPLTLTEVSTTLLVTTPAPIINTANITSQTTITAPVPAVIPQLLTPEEFESDLATYSVLYVYIGLFVYFSSLIQITCWQIACERQIHRIRLGFFKSVLRQELSWFDTNRSGELSSKFNDDIDRIRDGLGEQFSSVIKYSSSFLSGFVVGFIVSWRLTLVILAATPLLALFSAYLGKMLSTSTKREQEKYAIAGALAEEVLVAIRTVFALGGQRNEIENYKTKLESSKKMAQIKYLKLGLIVGASMLVLYSTYGLALYVATMLLASNTLTAGAAMTVIMSVMMGASALGNIIPPYQTISMSLASATLIYDIIDLVPRIDASNDRGLKLSKVTANIKFENVTFSYPLRESVPVIKNLNFELNQGQTVAICGRTGSGKSTIMNLLLRFYDPDEGCIYLDNCNLCDLNVAWLRSLAGIVEQEPALFDCSIFENISLGATQESDKTYERIIEAAKLANAHEFIINLPDGYNTRCGDRGVQMSGGQKQRIAIARALLCDPKILLLDEATSALDSESEFMVQSALNRARQGRTTIIIAHRLSTIRDADSICVMDDGNIVEMGRHDELMANKRDYYNLVTNQVFTDAEDENTNNGRGGSGNNGNNSDLSLSDDIDSDSNNQTYHHQQQQQRFQQLSTDQSKITNVSMYLEKTGSTTRTSFDPSEITRISKKHSTTLYESINRPLKSLVEFHNGNDDKVDLPTTKDIIRLLKPEMKWIIMGTLASILSGAMLPTFALFYAQIFDTFTKNGTELIESGTFWALMFVVLSVLMFITMFLRIIVMSIAIEQTMARLRAECFANILKQHVGWFDNIKNSPQRLTTRLASDVPQIKAVINARLSSFISGLATITAALIIAFYLGWKLAILLTIALPVLLYVGYLQMRLSRGDRAQYVLRMENASRLATEAIEHVKLIQAINQERFFFEKFSNELEKPKRDSLKSARRFGFVYGLSQSFIYFIYGGAFRWGAYLMAREELDPITVFRIFFSIAFTAVAVGQWGGIGGDMSRTNYAIGLIIKLLNTQSQIDNLSRGGIKPRLKGLVTLQDVYFRYPTRPDTPVLQGLKLTVKPGQTLALVGPSGNGKSTIASLLLRFYDPDKGVVRIDDYDIRCVNLNHLRMNIGLVSQEPCLFKASIKDNILYGLDRSRYSMKDVINAAKLANIDDFISSLPEGYNTQVGERGTQMSGGQKQRIAIARTMIRNPTVLILDEATSALDAESEALVNNALEIASKGKTCIKIAHRLSTVRDADQIAVIEKGQVVEIGTHDELMAIGKKGFYFKLMQKQEISR